MPSEDPQEQRNAEDQARRSWARSRDNQGLRAIGAWDHQWAEEEFADVPWWKRWWRLITSNRRRWTR